MTATLRSGGRLRTAVLTRLGAAGDWLEMQDYAWSWGPPVGRGWGRHTGQWVMTDDGWFWVPGTEWAPAWISRRHGTA